MSSKYERGSSSVASLFKHIQSTIRFFTFSKIKCLLEEVDTNHLPESVKDVVVDALLSHKSDFLASLYSLFQSNRS